MAKVKKAAAGARKRRVRKNIARIQTLITENAR